MDRACSVTPRLQLRGWCPSVAKGRPITDQEAQQSYSSEKQSSAEVAHITNNFMNNKPYILALVLGAVLQATSMGQLPAPVVRPPVGVPADAKPFNGKWYKVFTEKKIQWTAARDKCRSMSGQLVVIPDEPTWAFVKTLTPAHVWLGATDEKVEGVWMWVDGTPMTFTAWYPGEPNGLYDAKQDYAMLKFNSWNDIWNSNDEVVGFICEWRGK